MVMLIVLLMVVLIVLLMVVLIVLLMAVLIVLLMAVLIVLLMVVLAQVFSCIFEAQFGTPGKQEVENHVVTSFNSFQQRRLGFKQTNHQIPKYYHPSLTSDFKIPIIIAILIAIINPTRIACFRWSL